VFKQFRKTASGHPRYGSRHTRRMSKLGVKPISGDKLEQIIKKDKEKRREADSK
jgi:hypothetical protein